MQAFTHLACHSCPGAVFRSDPPFACRAGCSLVAPKARSVDTKPLSVYDPSPLGAGGNQGQQPRLSAGRQPHLPLSSPDRPSHTHAGSIIARSLRKPFCVYYAPHPHPHPPPINASVPTSHMHSEPFPVTSQVIL